MKGSYRDLSKSFYLGAYKSQSPTPPLPEDLCLLLAGHEAICFLSLVGRGHLRAVRFRLSWRSESWSGLLSYPNLSLTLLDLFLFFFFGKKRCFHPLCRESKHESNPDGRSYICNPFTTRFRFFFCFCYRTCVVCYFVGCYECFLCIGLCLWKSGFVPALCQGYSLLPWVCIS